MRNSALARIVLPCSAVLLASSPLVGCTAFGAENESNVTVEKAEKALRGVKGLVDETRDAKLPVSLENPNARIQLAKDIYIHLPNAADNSDGKEIVPGLVAFSGKNYTTNAAQVTRNKETRLLNIIAGQQAPETFAYKLDMPESYELRTTDRGDEIIVDTKKGNKPVFAFPKPWAQDAKGKDVETAYGNDGHTLVQYVFHKDHAYTYPIVADPWWATALKVLAGGAFKTPTPYALAWCVGNGIYGYYQSDNDGWLRFRDGAISCVGV
ncbi:hypothetical protein [Streptomyces adonidis]|uniref:hypothetical protein n=1 Tax=Streptomyces adonidis TaxID=3231367 RepID=UPI0034DB1CA2